MEQRGVENVSVTVQRDEGHIIGDILRKYATRSVAGWQVIGYKTESSSPNFGFSNGALVSYLELFRGYIVSKGGSGAVQLGTCITCDFKWNGTCFDSDEFELRGLQQSIGEKITACLMYEHGHRTATQNMETMRDLMSGGASGYYAVPSSHTRVSTFKYRVSPIDESSEELSIEADTGVIRSALNSAIRSLSGLGI